MVTAWARAPPPAQIAARSREAAAARDRDRGLRVVHGRPKRRRSQTRGETGGGRHGAVSMTVTEGDITALEVDAIANAANDRLWMGAGVAGAITRAGGDEIEREAVAKVPIPVGDAEPTGAGRLPHAT